MKRILVAISAFCFLLFVFKLVAQDTWIKTYEPFDNLDYDYFPEDIVVCQDGGYAVNGYVYYYNDEFQIYDEWGFLLKTDSDGNLLWAKKDIVDFMNDNNSQAFVETSDGGFISACSGGVLIKRDSNGNREWVVDGDFGTNSMCNTSDGNIVLGGTQNLNIGLRKIDENGNTIWTRVYPIDDDYSVCKSIIQTQDGGYALTGYLDYEDRADADIIVMKTDANGDSLWTRTYDGYGYWDSGRSLAQNSDGKIMVAGEIEIPNIRGFLWYLDETGNTIWTQEADSSIGYSHCSVLSLSESEFLAYCYSGYGGNREATVYKFNCNYNIDWCSEFDANIAKGDKSILTTADESIVIVLRDVGNHSVSIAKTDDMGQIVSVSENEIPTIKNNLLSAHPNPFNPSTAIYYDIPYPSRVSLKTYNMKGQLIATLVEEEQNEGKHTVIWDAKNCGSGIYLIRLSINNCPYKVLKTILVK